MGRRTRRNKYQAMAAEHRATQAKPKAPRVGATSKVISTGSIQSAPATLRVGGGNKAKGIESPDPRMKAGIKLQPFSDYVPSTPADYATIKANHVTQDKQVWARINADTRRKCTASEEKCLKNHADTCIMGRVYESTIPDREATDAERAKLDVRPAHEARMMAVDRASGAETFQSYAQRHEDDAKAGLYRDGLGRIMRTEDMEEYADKIVDLTGDHATGWDNASLTCELTDTGRVVILEVNSVTGETRRRGQSVVRPVDSTMTTMDYAHMHGVPVQRNTTQKAHAKAKESAARKAARQAEREAREQARIQRKLDRASGRGATVADRRERDERARAMLAELGVTNPTKFQMNAARDVLIAEEQVKAYTGGNA